MGSPLYYCIVLYCVGYSMMHKCIMVKMGEAKNLKLNKERKLSKKNVN